MKKRGQLNLPFVYIFMIIVIAFILLFGYNIVTKLNTTKEKAVYLTFKTDINEEVERMYNKNKGSLTTFSKTSSNRPLQVPSDVKEVCIDNNKVKFDNINYRDFDIENMKSYNDGFREICINTRDGLFEFKLENSVVENNVYVLIEGIS